MTPTEAQSPPAVNSEQQTRLQQADVAASLAFARIVSILMRSPQYAQFPLGDLQRLVIPPIIAGQYAIMDGAPEGAPMPMPLAMALWAWVSPEIDHRLTADPAEVLRLGPLEWTSGANLWLVEAVGDPRVLPHLLKRLAQTQFKGRVVKGRQARPDGSLVSNVLLSQAVTGEM